ncbi:MAG: hypothetical protein M1840_000795 [Geoglossum simile]|nr:MAG: hypothetical protein M1840_000795 [Geoglossum simile]
MLQNVSTDAPYHSLSTPHQLSLANAMAAIRTSQPRPPHCGLIATAVRNATDAKPDTDTQASDAKGEVDNINAGVYIASHAKPSIFDKANESPNIQPSVLSKSDHELHTRMARLTLGNSDCGTGEFPKAEWNAMPTDSQLLTASLGLEPAPLRVPVAIMYKADENGHYSPNNDSTSAQRHKVMANPKSCGVVTDEDYVNVMYLPAAEDAQGHMEVDDDTDSLASSPVLVGDSDCDSDDFSDLVLD